MRDQAPIWEAWTSAEPKAGDFKPCTRVTVEKSYRLRLSGTEDSVSRTVGTWTRGPARWFQRAETGDQIETEIPNLRSVTIDRSIDTDAATCEITVTNTKDLAWGEGEETPGQYGRPGYYTWSRGTSQEAIARWGHVRNEWRDVLVPNALLRTYMGYGGHDKTLTDAVADGNLVLTGVWLVDEVQISTNGELHLRCRDMGKLLVDQQLFPPLVPMPEYPLLYQRYVYDEFTIPPDPPPGVDHEIITWSTGSADGLGDYVDTPPMTVRASSDPDGQNLAIFGHRPADAMDMSHDQPDGDGNYAHQFTYWLSEGYGAASGSDAYPWIECNAFGHEVNLVYLHPWAGNFLFYVSVWENGGWAPPDGGGQGGIVPSTNPDAAVPFVCSYGSTWEGGSPAASNQYALPRTYLAGKIRVTLSNLTLAQEGGYRGGIRKLMPQLDKTTAHYPTLVFSCCPMPDGAGYWQVRSDGRHYAFGDARTAAISGTTPVQTHSGWVLAINANADGSGYWTMDLFGRVLAFGAANWEGDLSDSGRSDVVDFAPTSSGEGYYLLCRDGSVHPFGDAVDHGAITPTGTMPSGAAVQARAIESHPTTAGYWVLWSDGTVKAFDLAHHGNANRFGFGVSEYVGKLRRTSTGGGYYVNSGSGIMQTFGDAVHRGNGTPRDVTDWVNGLCWDFTPDWESDAGYAVQHADGRLDYLGDFLQFGSIGEGHGTLRKDGDYKDYSDIIRELLLWSGFYLWRDPQPNRFPDVYGNIETTGAFAVEDLPHEMFDKKPVMNAITAIKEIVGFLFYIDDEGGARFEAPNWWAMGNFDYTGNALDIMPDIDEQVQLTDYQVGFHDSEARSEIIIATENPYPTITGQPPATDVVQTRYVPPSAVDLKGLCKPAMWTNGVFTNLKEQQMMAELIAMHIWFARRTGEITCRANPLIGPNDQVRIYERQTAESWVHYVRGSKLSHNLDSGDFTQTLSTHWLGGTPTTSQPYFFACAPRPQFDGYWQVGSTGDVYAFGAAQLAAKNETATHLETVVGLRASPTGQGYYTLDVSGKVITHGDGVHQGDLFERDVNVKDFALTPSGAGYYLLRGDGSVEVFGDAVHQGDTTVTGTMPSGSPVQAESIEAHPDGGYWILRSDGTVDGHGIASLGDANRDGFALTEYVSCLRATAEGDGYFIVSGRGIVQNFGAAINEGSLDADPTGGVSLAELVWDLLPMGGGYIVQQANGALTFFGTAIDRGGVGATTDTVLWVIDEAGTSTDPNVLHLSADLRAFLKRVESNATAGLAHGTGDGPTQKAIT